MTDTIESPRADHDPTPPLVYVNDGGRSELIRRIEYILDPTASAAERSHRRMHLTNHDLRMILNNLEGHRDAS